MRSSDKIRVAESLTESLVAKMNFESLTLSYEPVAVFGSWSQIVFCEFVNCDVNEKSRVFCPTKFNIKIKISLPHLRVGLLDQNNNFQFIGIHQTRLKESNF